MLGNALVGNPPDAAALEITLSGPTLEAECDLACVVYGAPFELHSERQHLVAGKTFTLAAGERLEIGGTRRGSAPICASRGGLQEKDILGSRSGLGPLGPGAELPCTPAFIPSRFAHMDLRTESEKNVEELLMGSAKPLRVLPGPQMAWFRPEDFFGETGDWQQPPLYEVTPQSNRMGLRLKGAPVTVPAREMVSEPVCPGAVQVTRDGQCIILGVDGQTIGGYPKIAQVISADLDLLGQLRPGDRVFFGPVNLEEAEGLYRARQARLREWLTRLQVSLGAFRPVALRRRS